MRDVSGVLPHGFMGMLLTLWLLFQPLWAADEASRESNRGHGSRPLEVESSPRHGFTLMPAKGTGIAFTNVLSDAEAAANQIRLNGSGVALGDVDGDGWCDIYLCGLENPNALYRNLGGWRFEEVTTAAGVGCAGQYSTGATFADVDGDDDLDLLVGGMAVGTRLFINDGRGRFTESKDAGLERRWSPTTATLGDVDGDGDLDLYVTNYRTETIRSTGFAVYVVNGRRMIPPKDRDRLEYTAEGRILEHGEPDVLYLNDGTGRFKTVSWVEGAFLEEDGKPLKRPPFDWGLSAMFRDLNGDLAPDLFVCNDFHSTDKIWINDGRGTFKPISRLALRHTSTFSMSIDFGDLNRDGHEDILVADMLSRDHVRRQMQLALMDPFSATLGAFDDRPQVDRTVLQLNRGDGTYADVACYAGLDLTDWTWSAVLLDVDLDGYEDVLCATGHMFDTQDLDAEARIQAKGPWRREMIPQKLLMFSRMPQENLAFRNRGDLTFEPAGAKWGFNQVGVSQGMALGDLDNDGDLDVVVNQLNGAAGVFRSDSAAPRVLVRLKGQGGNTRGVGARIRLTGGAVPLQMQEMMCGGRYLSGDDASRVFAVGAAGKPMELEVIWRSGKRSRIPDVQPNCVYDLREERAVQESAATTAALKPLFVELGALPHRHVENEFDDFARQPLLPNRLSRLGPGVAWHDLDGDGWEDLVIGSGIGGALTAFRNGGQGRFEAARGGVWDQVLTRDLGGMVSWGTSLMVASMSVEDGMALGSAVFRVSGGAPALFEMVPADISSVGPLAAGDMDGDGDLDLLVGGRVVPGKYPVAASSRLYRSEGDRLLLDDHGTAALKDVGLVSAALWSDLDGDGLPELVLACEWGPVRVMARRREVWRDLTREWGLAAYAGWWNGLNAGDFDGDGRMDLVASNWGLNTRYRATMKRPLKLYHGDFDGNGIWDILESYFHEGLDQEMPERDLLAMSAGWPAVKARFATHHDYGRASVQDLLGSESASVQHVEATTLASMLFLNRGGRFEAVRLPAEAQFAPAFAVCVGDMDGDGHEDAFLSQNHFSAQPRTPRSDAGRGLWLRGDGRGGLAPVSGQESGVTAYGEQRGAALADFDHDGRLDLVVAQNAAATRLFRNQGGRVGLRVRLRGPAGNRQGIGAVIRARTALETGPAREVHSGAGYWSQDGVVQVLGGAGPIRSVWVRWPGGKITESPVAEGAAEIEISHDQR